MNKQCGITSLQSQSMQQGAILIVALIVLIVMVSIAISSGGGALIEEQMTNNAKNRQIALQSAEAIVRHAENLISGNLGPQLPFEPFNETAFTADCQNGFCERSTGAPLWLNYPWGNATKVIGFSNLASQIQGPPTQPVYFVELLSQYGGNPPAVCPIVILRIVGRAVAPNGAISHVETIYNHRPNAFLNGSC